MQSGKGVDALLSASELLKAVKEIDQVGVRRSPQAADVPADHPGYTCVRLQLSTECGIDDNEQLSKRIFDYRIVKRRNYPKQPEMQTLKCLLMRTLANDGVFECEINWADHTGITVLMVACYLPCELKMVKELLSFGANPLVLDVVGRSALHYAAEKGRLEVIKLLVLNAGVPVNVHGSINWTPMLSAVVNERRDCIKLLMELDVTTKTSCV